MTACFVPPTVVHAAISPAPNPIATVTNEYVSTAFWARFWKLLVDAFADEASNSGERKPEVCICECVGVRPGGWVRRHGGILLWTLYEGVPYSVDC